MIPTSIHHYPVLTRAFIYSLFHPSVPFSFLFCFLATARFFSAPDTKWLIYKLISYSFPSVFLFRSFLAPVSCSPHPPIFLLLLSFALFSLFRLSDTHIKVLYFLLPVQFASLTRLTLDCIFSFKERIIRI